MTLTDYICDDGHSSDIQPVASLTSERRAVVLIHCSTKEGLKWLLSEVGKRRQ